MGMASGLISRVVVRFLRFFFPGEDILAKAAGVLENERMVNSGDKPRRHAGL